MIREPKFAVIILSEIRELFLQRRIYHFVPLIPLGVFLEAWIYPVGSPVAPVLLIVLIALEPQFNNNLFRTPGELEALGLFPIRWREIILAKNIAAVLLFLFFAVLSSLVLFYFSPDRITPARISDGIAYIITILFPLLHFGNEHSIRHPRRNSGIRLEDFIYALWMCVNILLVSIPYYIFSQSAFSYFFCLVYGVLTAGAWFRYSIGSTATKIEQEYDRLCLTP